ncbi:RHS repeat-associated core domain-containing protein, partial [Bacillus cereus]|uniref:RHS repeat-associated core domain-containing protein n=1 Tax=Bacillus cereus TaxID=1396 RepID=UPI002414195D
GYRYYMPWLGRWLNPDPAGTVDGLNLYRMVRNNPINLIDPDGNAPQDSKGIVGNFRKGDLIYGLTDARHTYRVDILSSLEPKKVATTIDEYNDIVSEMVMMSNENHRYLPSNSQQFASYIKIPAQKYLKKFVKQRKEEKSFPLWGDYFKAGEKNVKFHIYSIYKEVAEEFGKDYYHQYYIHDTSEYGHAPALLWKRGSKLGLAMAASNKKTTIHFVLDGLDTEHVVNKTKGTEDSTGPGESITSSELRYVYRNYNKLKGRVNFYRNKEKIDKAPWEENPGLWAKYQPTNRPIRKF